MKTKHAHAIQFRRSIIRGTACQVLRAAADILCGYLVSFTIASALALNTTAAIQAAAVLGAVLAARVPVNHWLTKGYEQRRLGDLQEFRKSIYWLILNRRIEIAGKGALDVKLDRDVQAISGYYQSALPRGIGAAIALLCSAVLLFLSSWQIGLTLFLLNLVQFLPMAVYEGWAKKIYAKTRSDEECYRGWILEGSLGLSTIKLYGQEPWYLQRFSRLSKQIYRTGQKAEWTGTAENMAAAVVNTLLNYGSYFIIGLFILSGVATASQAPMMIVLMQYLYRSTEELLQWRMGLLYCKQASIRLAPQEQLDKPAMLAEETVLLSAQGVKKRYSDRWVLEAVSLCLRPGEKVLLCGKNGSGKSTLLRLLLHVEAPDQGEIRYSSALLGTDETLSIAYALQEEIPLPLSGKALIAPLLSAGTVDAGKLREYLDSFHCPDAQLEVPLSALSMGQRKKIFLAIALARPAPLLILDEPFNHLDPDSAAALERILGNWDQALLLCNHAPVLQAFWDRTVTIERGHLS